MIQTLTLYYLLVIHGEIKTRKLWLHQASPPNRCELNAAKLARHTFEYWQIDFNGKANDLHFLTLKHIITHSNSSLRYTHTHFHLIIQGPRKP